MSELKAVEEVLEANRRFIWTNTVARLISPELIEEHHRDPFGHHTPNLDLVLAFLRSDSSRSKPQYVIVCTVPEKEWVIGEHRRRRGEQVQLESERYVSVQDAEHAVFLKRLSDLGISIENRKVTRVR